VSVVSDTGPLIALAKVDLLPILHQLYKTVEIPEAVHRELIAKPSAETPRLQAAFCSFIQVAAAARPTPQQIVAQLSHLGEGERAAITLAADRGTLLIIDDHAARRAAKDLGVRFTGTAGVIIAAKDAGAIPLVRPVLERMRYEGYWLSDDVISAATELAREA